MFLFFFPESDLDVEAVSLISTTDSSTSSFTVHLSTSALASTTPAELQTGFPDPTSSSQIIEKLGFDILSTATQLWESPISRQEGSASLETEDTVTMESGEKQLHPTKAEDNLVSGVSSATTESPEGSSTSQLPTDSTTAGYRTSGYRVYLDTATTAYEEASGQEPSSVTSIVGEDIKVTSTLEEDVTVNSILVEEIKVSPTIEEEAEVSFSLEQEVKAPPTPKENITVTPTLEDEVKVSFSLEQNVTVAPTHEEETYVASTLEQEPSITPTLEEVTNVSPTFEEEVSLTPSLEEVNIVPTLEETTAAPTLEEEAYVSPPLEEEANFASALEEEVNISSTVDEETTISPTIEANVASALEEEASFAPTVEEDFTIFPLDSQTSSWDPLTTTSGPQESLNDLEYSGKTSTVALDSPSSTKPTTATAKTTTATITTTTHWSRRAWSPTTSRPRVFHKTTEPQKVTHLIPPVDQGLVDVEFSLTQPPTLLILPNERAAVGGTGKSSGNVKATLISLTVLLLLLDAMMH